MHNEPNFYKFDFCALTAAPAGNISITHLTKFMNKLNFAMACGVSILLLSGCSKKEMLPISTVAQANNGSTFSKQVTWAQGDTVLTGTYNIFSMDGNKALEIPVTGTTKDALPQLNSFNNHNGQKWNITEAGDGYFKIENAGSGLALAAVKTDLSALQQTAFSGSDEQLWKIQHQKQGLYNIVNRATNRALTLDGGGVTASTYTGSEKQLLNVTLQEYALATDSVTIDFSSMTDSMKHVASGFLHGFIGNTSPPDSLILPLKINTVRDWIFDYDLRGPRLNALGYTQQIVISDGFAAPYGSNGPPGNGGNWSSWDGNVAATVNEAMSAAPGAKLQYDIWNEPDNGSFWNFTGTYAFPGWFYQTWLHGYQKARTINPNAVIVGPSFSQYNAAGLEAFLLYCKANNCVPNYLSWHFPSDPVSQANEMNQFMAANNIHVDGIIINEYTLSSQQTAGKNAYLIAQLERAKVSAAMHAIWGSTGSGQLDGILTPATDGNQKLATWWVYKAYGDMSGKIVSTIPSANIELLAALNDNPRLLKVLLGCRAQAGQGVIKVKFLNITPEITNNNTSVHFTLQRIPDALNAGAITPTIPTQFNSDVTIAYGNKVTLLITWNSEYDAFTFNVGKPTN